jgi:hypothetical protein
LVGEYILKPCSGSKFSYCSKNRTLLSISYHSSTYFSSIFSEVLTVMISPLCTNCHDITVILLNVALNTNSLTLYLQRHIPTYLSINIFMRIIDFFNFCHGRKASWNVKWYGKYGRKISWMVKWFGKYRRKLWNDRENTDENSEKIRKIWKKSKLNSEMHYSIYLCNVF